MPGGSGLDCSPVSSCALLDTSAIMMLSSRSLFDECCLTRVSSLQVKLLGRMLKYLSAERGRDQRRAAEILARSKLIYTCILSSVG